MQQQATDEREAVQASVRRELCAAPDAKGRYYPADAEVFEALSPYHPDTSWRFTGFEFAALRRHGYINTEGGPSAPTQIEQGATFSWTSTARLLCGR